MEPGTTNKHIVVIVDALSTGIYFASHLKKRGYACVHVLSSPNIKQPLLDAIRMQDFIEHIVYHGSIDSIISSLQKYNVVLAIPGSEAGVALADTISRHLQLPCNDTTISLARRNKYMMQENVRARGLRAIKEKYAQNVDEVVSWADSKHVWPIVVKPVASAGTEGVHFCATKEEVAAAFAAIMHHTNAMGLENTAVLAQERIQGEECIVNTVSYNGKHYITDHWKYRKMVVEHSSPIYDYVRLMPHPAETNRALVHYDADVLDALGFLVGPAHAEIMLTETGPVLIEVGARVMGASIPPEIISECIGHNQLDLTLDCFLNHKHFLQHIEQPYTMVNHCIIKLLISYTAGHITRIPGKSIIEQLPSARIVRIYGKPSEYIPKTVDMFTSPGEIILINKDPDALEADYQRICELEENGLFEME